MGEIVWSDIYDDAVFISPKFYYLKNLNNETLKLKGIKINNYSFDKIKNDFYKNKDFLSFDNQLNFSRNEYVLFQKYLKKNISLNLYNKRIFDKSKKKTIPISHTNNEW